jgi:hypothetical protein
MQRDIISPFCAALTNCIFVGMDNKPLAGWRVVAGFWGFSALICLPILNGGTDTVAGLVFLILLISTSTYLYSARFATFINGLLSRFNLIA